MAKRPVSIAQRLEQAVSDVANAASVAATGSEIGVLELAMENELNPRPAKRVRKAKRPAKRKKAAPRKRKAPVMCKKSSHSYLPKAAATLVEPADGKIDPWRKLSDIFSS